MERILVNAWHIINGIWFHICQVERNDGIYYYTDGVLEE